MRVRHRRPPSGASLTPQKKESTLPVQPDLTSYSPWTPKKQESTLPLQQTPSSTLAQQKQESTPSLQDEPLKQGSNPFLQNEVEKAFREAVSDSLIPKAYCIYTFFFCVEVATLARKGGETEFRKYSTEGKHLPRSFTFCVLPISHALCRLKGGNSSNSWQKLALNR